MTIPNFIFLFILSLFIPVGLGSSQQLTCGKIFAHSGKAGSGEGTGGREDQRKRHISVAEKARYEETYFIDFSKGPSRVFYSRNARLLPKFCCNSSSPAASPPIGRLTG